MEVKRGILKHFLERAAGSISPGRDLYRKLSRPQKISLLLVVGILSFALFLSFFPGTQPPYRALLIGEGPEGAARLQLLVSRLQENSIPWRERNESSGLRAIEVPDGESYQRALQLLGKEGDPSSTSSGDWPYKGGFLESPDRFKEKLLEYHRRRIEQAILWNKNIEKVTIGLPPSPGQRFVGERGSGDSAAVVLQLKSGVTALSRSETDAIRSMVSSAFNLRPEKVSLSDNAGHSYQLASGPSVPLDIQEEEDRCRSKILRVIQGYCRNAFREDEFYVGVIVSLSTQRSSVEREEVDRDKTFNMPTKSEYEETDQKPLKDDPSTGGILTESSHHFVLKREKTDERTFPTREKTRIDIPPGQVKAVSVSVLLDLEAVERVLGKTEASRRKLPGDPDDGRDELAFLPKQDREAMIQDYVKGQEDSLGSLLKAFESPSIRVMVHPFNKLEPSTISPAPLVTASAGPEPLGTIAPGLFAAWKEVLWISALALLLCFVVLELFRRLKQGRAPDLAYAVPGALDGSADWGSASRQGSAGLSPRRGRNVQGTLQDGILRSVSDISTLVRGRPDVAASVLRFWLSQDGDDGRDGRDGKGGGRS